VLCRRISSGVTFVTKKHPETRYNVPTYGKGLIGTFSARGSFLERTGRRFD
jgi:hypothetical protein